jgi:ParB family transcriptional regulator, chromosome partitioning protein
MSTRKKYSLPQGISSEITNTVNLVKNNIGTLNYKLVPLSAIEFDPCNPRDLAITREELPEGPQDDDPLYEKKMKEFESLKQTAETIKKYGVRNAVEIYKFGTSYRLIHGERRCLSSILAGKNEIPAKILNEKPNDFDIRLLQLIENAQREDLSLYETLNNVKQVIQEYKMQIDDNITVDSIFLEGLINRSKTHCLIFLSVLHGPESLVSAIKQGKINSLEKAAIIARAKSEQQRDALMRSCLGGASLKQLKKESQQQKKIERMSNGFTKSTEKKRPGKKASKINLGSTKNPAVISKIVQLVSMDPLYERFNVQFNQMSFDDFGSCSSAISALIGLMEKIESN